LCVWPACAARGGRARAGGRERRAGRTRCLRMRRALARARAPRAPALPRDARAGRAQKDEQSKLMKEYDKKNKENDMSLSSKKKEDFGACAHRAEILNWLCGAAPARRARGAPLRAWAAGAAFALRRPCPARARTPPSRCSPDFCQARCSRRRSRRTATSRSRRGRRTRPLKTCWG
jgi:hypothetical protein